MTRIRIAIAAAALVGLGLGARRAPGQMLTWEAEGLASNAVIRGGGELLVFGAGDAERLAFSGGRALSFVPRGKGASVELTLPAPDAGVYQLRVRGVSGPSCGVYDIVLQNEVRGWANFSGEVTRHTDQTPGMQNGYWTKRLRLAQGENRIRFVHRQSPRRGGNLVLDTLQLVPYRSTNPQFDPDPCDAQIPAGERHGPELLRNRGFDEFAAGDRFEQVHQVIKSWCFNTPIPTGVVCIVRDPAQAHGGQNALALAPDPLEDNAVLYQPNVPTESGKRYRVSLFARGTGRLDVVFYQPGTAKAEDSERASNRFRAGPDWAQYSFVFAPSRAGHVSAAALALYAWEGSRVYFDDVSVSEMLDEAPPRK